MGRVRERERKRKGGVGREREKGILLLFDIIEMEVKSNAKAGAIYKMIIKLRNMSGDDCSL